MNISDYLVKIQDLTNTNLQLLKALNDSFYSDQSNLKVDLGDAGSFVIPSFISLENKINTLQSNFENLVNAPITNEAYFAFDGNSRSIEVRRYEQGPAPLVLQEQTTFEHENNDVLKDFLTPVPYLKFNVTDLPNDITSCVVRKVSALTSELKNRFATLLGDAASKQMNWGDVKKLLDDLTEDTDYTLYDTTQKLPIRHGQGSGVYVVREIIDEEIDENLDQHITVRFANDINGYQKSLTYLANDQTIEKELGVGDYIVSWDGRAKFQIEELNFNTNEVKMLVVHGEYADIYPFTETTPGINPSDVSKMRFFSEMDPFSNENYVKVPLEENQYIFVAVAPLNDRMNIRASWGDGLLVDVDKLTADDGQTSFREYYNTCVNIGDILNEISKVMSNTVSKHTNEELNYFMTAKPTIDTDILKVTYINKHLDDTPTIQNIRALYSQKNTYNAALVETQNSLTVLEDTLASIDFEDTTGIRAQTQNQIDELTKKKNELVNSLMKITNEIALTANNSVVPIEAPKYRIRGFFDYVGFVNSIKNGYNISEQNIKGILVQYRYRNVQQESGTAETFVKDVNDNGQLDDEDKTFIFSDWNVFNSFLRPRIRTSDGEYEAEPDNSNKNEPSFNQIDIPITQGEIVDVRLKVIYDFGYPFIQMTSGWSDVTTFEFPVEFMKDVSVVSIIEENNNDIETNRFESILINNGVLDHVGDKLVDQDKTFFHKPENISSGFYTAERRVIPLRDKLKSMDDSITQLLDEVTGATADQLQVSIDYDESSIIISPYEVGRIVLKGFEAFTNESAGMVGNYGWDSDNQIASLIFNIRLTNTSSHSLKIFPMFYGNDDTTIGPDLKNYKFDVKDFYSSLGDNGGVPAPDVSGSSAVWCSVPVDDTDSSDDSPYDVGRDLVKQTPNQFITFRTKNPYNGNFYYSSDETNYTDQLEYLPSTIETIGFLYGSISPEFYALIMYPYLINENGLKMTYEQSAKYMLLNSGDELVVPIKAVWRTGEDTHGKYVNLKQTMSFDIRTSLYSDPLTYAFEVTAPYEETTDNKMVSSLTRKYNNRILNSRKYNSIVR